ncbi:E1-E2 ATPase-domain-containing protein [Xylariomycetidae sp. FL2044]|nr:E1-E2 ATPase-domain-containing protein [Xylariomycetidae sp. FL2044]
MYGGYSPSPGDPETPGVGVHKRTKISYADNSGASTDSFSAVSLNRHSRVFKLSHRSPDFQLANNPFAFGPEQLSRLLGTKSLPAFHALGGLNGLERGLQTDLTTGLDANDTIPPPSKDHEVITASTGETRKGAFVDRVRIFGRNTPPLVNTTPFWEFFRRNFQGLTLLKFATTLALTAMSLSILSNSPSSFIRFGATLTSVVGIASCVVKIIGTLIQSLYEQRDERLFMLHRAQQSRRQVKVIRSQGNFTRAMYSTDSQNILVGDILLLEPGDVVPADGVLIDGLDLRCDEHAVTGELGEVEKTGGDEVSEALLAARDTGGLDPFILSGSKVTQGVGAFVCTAVGRNTQQYKRLVPSSSRAVADGEPSCMRILGYYLGLTRGVATRRLQLWFAILGTIGVGSYMTGGKTLLYSTPVLTTAIPFAIRIVYRDIFTSRLDLLSRWRQKRQSRADRLAQGRMFEIHGFLNGRSIVANADTGATYNVISERLAKSMNFKPRPGTQGNVLLPSGSHVRSQGQIKAQFKFAGEDGIREILCTIMPVANYDLVLGGSFLKVTNTFTKHRDRLTRIFSCPLRILLNLIGSQQDVVAGFLNGQQCLAVPDSGSDIMALSRGYAKRLGLKVYRGAQYRSKIQFIDGSKTVTDGIVKGVKWQFRPGEAPIKCDFHVIRRLPVRVILSNALIDEYDVFSKYSDRIGQHDPKGAHHRSGVYGISLVERCREELRNLSDSFVDDITSANPFTPEKVDRERARRDQIRDWIAQLPMPTLDQEKAKEEQRQQRWNELWQKHRHAANANRPNSGQVQGQSQATAGTASSASHHASRTMANSHAARQKRTSGSVARRFPFLRKWL